MICLALPRWLLTLGRSLCLCLLCVICDAEVAQAQTPRVFRCGNVYTNQPMIGQNCQPMTGGHVTVIEGTQVPVASVTPASPASTDAASSNASALKVDTQAQRQRDAQATALLQMELQKAQARHAELLQLWRNGEPERQADELRQPQKYHERVAQLRAALQRSEADLAGLQRELARLPTPPVVKSTP